MQGLPIFKTLRFKASEAISSNDVSEEEFAVIDNPIGIERFAVTDKTLGDQIVFRGSGPAVRAFLVGVAYGGDASKYNLIG